MVRPEERWMLMSPSSSLVFVVNLKKACDASRGDLQFRSRQKF